MPQLLFTPAAIYRYFRQLVKGYDSAGSESEGFYISKNIVPATLAGMKLAYFKIGVGGPISGEITRDFFDTGADGAEAGTGCKDQPSSADTKGDLNVPIHIFATAAKGYLGASRDKKALVNANFANYGDSNASKVVGTLSVVSGGSGDYWDVPGVLFQVACHLQPGEGNYDKDGVIVTAPAVVDINEIGVFDAEDTMILYGTFPARAKNNTLTFKANCVAMLKALDYQLVLMPTTSSTSSSTSTITSSTNSTSTNSTSTNSTSTNSTSTNSTSSQSSSTQSTSTIL